MPTQLPGGRVAAGRQVGSNLAVSNGMAGGVLGDTDSCPPRCSQSMAGGGARGSNSCMCFMVGENCGGVDENWLAG